MRRFLITGGAGFIGSHIAEAIVSKDLGEVVVYDNLSSGKEENLRSLGDRVRLVRGDIRMPNELVSVLKGCEVVFHEAAFVSAFDSYNQPELTNAVNIDGTFNVLTAARKAGCRRVVLASSAAIYGTESALPNSEEMLPRPLSPYAIGKLCNEYHARLFATSWGLETVCLRYFNVYGPRQNPSSEYSGVISRFTDVLSAGRQPTIYGDGSQTRDFIFVKDVAQANLCAAFAEKCGHGEVINVGTGRETSLNMVLAALQEVYGREVHPEWKPWRDGDIHRSVAKVDRAREVIGFCADTEFVAGMRALVDALAR